MSAPTPAPGDVPPEAALRVVIASATPPPDVSAVDLLDDGETARVAYSSPSPDPGDPINQHAIERLGGAYLTLVDGTADPPERFEAVITDHTDDSGGAPTWHITREWAQQFLADDWDSVALFRRISKTTDALGIADG